MTRNLPGKNDQANATSPYDFYILAQRQKKIAILTFLLLAGVLLIGAGVVAYMINMANPAREPAAPSAIQSTPAINRSAISDLDWVRKIYADPVGNYYTFAFLPGEDEAKNNTVLETLKHLVSQVDKPEKKVTLFILDRSDPDYAATVNRLLIQETPAVIGLNYIGNIAIIKGNITFEKLYETYIISSSPTCPPAGGRCCGID